MGIMTSTRLSSIVDRTAGPVVMISLDTLKAMVGSMVNLNSQFQGFSKVL